MCWCLFFFHGGFHCAVSAGMHILCVTSDIVLLLVHSTVLLFPPCSRFLCDDALLLLVVVITASVCAASRLRVGCVLRHSVVGVVMAGFPGGHVAALWLRFCIHHRDMHLWCGRDWGHCFCELHVTPSPPLHSQHARVANCVFSLPRTGACRTSTPAAH